MAHLFKIEGKVVFPTSETLLIYPFDEIWKRDKTKEKNIAIQEFAYIEFTTSLKKSNPYKGYDSIVKAAKVKEDIIKDKKWLPDDLVMLAIKKLEKFQTEASATYSFFKSVKRATENLKEFFDNVDLGERNMKSGVPIYKPSDITRALNDADKLLSNLKSLETKVEEELFEESKTRGGKEISHFAKPSSIK